MLQACFERLLCAWHCAWQQPSQARGPVRELDEACGSRESVPWVTQDRTTGGDGAYLNHVVGESLSEWGMRELRRE